MSGPTESKSDGEGCNSIADWARNRKRRREQKPHLTITRFARGVSTSSAAQGLEGWHAFVQSLWITVSMTKRKALGSFKCFRSRRKWPPATPKPAELPYS